MRSKIVKRLKEKSQKMASKAAYEWATYFKRNIYIEATPDGYSPGAKTPKQAHYYEIGKTYEAWKTQPTLCFDYIGQVICTKSWWEEVYEYEPGTKIIGYLPRGQFKTKAGEIVGPLYCFITATVIKKIVDDTMEDFISMDIKELK